MLNLEELTPKKIVEELDKYIIGQTEAKKAVAIALRNRLRRQLLPDELKVEVMPKNIIMIGATGVGKTEIARRLSQLANVPFLKVEVTKFTEIGYVGRDVESMIRELTQLTVNMIKQEKMKEVEKQAEKLAEEKILDLLLPHSHKSKISKNNTSINITETRQKLCAKLREGKLDDKLIEIETKENISPVVEIFSGSGFDNIDFSFSEVFSHIFPPRMKRRKVSIKEAKAILTYQESQKLINMEQISKEAIKRVEEQGIIFLDEFDKITASYSKSGPDVSREGVQRDLLPIVEGSTVNTKYGPVRTHHILFIAAGTFHNSKPSELMPELQGRFPIRVELSPLTKEDFKKILTIPKNALIKQYIALMATEGVKLNFSEDAIEEIANFAYLVNEITENIGARRLYTVMEKVMEELSFEAPQLKDKEITIDATYVKKKLENIAKSEDLSRYIL